MDPLVLPLISGLVGALIGAATSIAGIVIQSRREDRKHGREIAAQLALEDWKHAFARVQHEGGSILPSSAYLAYHFKVVDALDGGGITPRRWSEISREFSELTDAIYASDSERKKRSPSR
jgi:hypothetical protein